MPPLQEVDDVSNGCGQAYNLLLVSPAFAGCKMTLARHRLVNGALSALLPRLHAFSQRTLTPAEWKAAAASAPASTPAVPAPVASPSA